MSRDLKSIFIRSCIETAWDQWWQTPDDAPSFLATLKVLRSGQYSATKEGYLVSSTSGAGSSTTVNIPVSPTDRNRLTPMTLQEMWQEVIEAYRVAADPANYGPTEDEGFLTYLLDLFTEVQGTMLDTTSLRFPSYGTIR